MKKLLFILLAFISINLNAEGLLQNVAKTANNVIDSTKLAVKEGVTLVDTSSNFKMIYTDVKEGLTGLAQGLKVGVEHVYIVLVKQQVVISITNTIVYIICLIMIIPLFKGFNWINKNTNTESNPAIIFYSVFVMGGFLIFTSTYFGFTINQTVAGFVNPEYGAIKDIINFVQNTSTTCSTCK